MQLHYCPAMPMHSRYRADSEYKLRVDVDHKGPDVSLTHTLVHILSSIC